MDKLGVLVRCHAKTGKEAEVESFLRSARLLAAKEPGTTTFCAFKFSASRFGFLMTFGDEEDVFEHQTGKLADAFMANTHKLIDPNPKIEWFEVVSIKGQGAGTRKRDHSSVGIFSRVSGKARVRWALPQMRRTSSP